MGSDESFLADHSLVLLNDFTEYSDDEMTAKYETASFSMPVPHCIPGYNNCGGGYHRPYKRLASCIYAVHDVVMSAVL